MSGQKAHVDLASTLGKMDEEEVIGDLLVVDDNPGDLRFIEEALDQSKLNPDVHSVTTSSEALAFLAQDPPYADAPHPDFVLLDWHLADTTADDVLRTVERDNEDVTVVVMTGSQTDQECIDTTLAEADAVLEKPTDPEGYIEAIRSI